MTPTVYLKILSKVNPELHQSLQDAATPVFHDPERIPAIYNQFTDTFALEKDPLIAKLKFISVILRLYSPASLIAEINVPHGVRSRSEEHTSELQSRENLVCRLLLEKKKQIINNKHK